jgi:hypothetical protein
MVCVLLYFFLRPYQHNGGARSQAYLYTSGMENSFAGNNSWNAANTSFFEVLALQNEV